MKNHLFFLIFYCLTPIALVPAQGKHAPFEKDTKLPEAFERLNSSPEWELQFSDACTGKWQDQWFLDGKLAKVENSGEGMNFTAGPVNRDDAHHAVLWTKASFTGDVKIEYNYTRTDSQLINVNILFIQATGIGGTDFDPDISQWNDYRAVPTMSKYWKNMNLIHISYAAFPTVNDDPGNDYIRVRRYPATENIPFRETEVPPAFERTGLFLPDVTYKMTWIKTNEQLMLRVTGNGETREYNWDLTAFPPVTEGRIGLRHMYTRSARYSDFKVYTRKGQYELENPISETYLNDHLSKQLPRLVLNSAREKQLRQQLKTNPLIQNLYQVIRSNAESLLNTDLITLDIPDNPNSQRNQLGISRNFLYRINMLAMVYRIEKDPKILRRINDEVVAACNFPSWNPRHFLDVGEMSLAIALALDWTAGELPPSTIDLAHRALIEKGIQPSWPENGETPRWVYGTNNWNQVCNAGMIAASIAVAEIAPALAAKTIKRSIDGMNRALAEYAPSGAYPEGAIYWGYGTMFSVVTASMFESAFGTDFGLADYPGFQESAVFRMLMTAPSKRLFNYADCAETPERYTDFTLSWFATKTGNRTYLNEEKFMLPPEAYGRISRLAGAGLVWTAQFQETATQAMPTAWKGEGANPIVVFTEGPDLSNGYYFGGKGGRANLSHGNMDSGSFIFELDGVRWVIDPGNQGYGPLERAGFNLWGRCQECDRWKLLTKNNFGHSTISVNDQLHQVDATASIVDFKAGAKPEATIDLSPTLAGQLASARRRFVKDGPRSLLIEDAIELSEETKLITWQLITTADVLTTNNGAVLKKDGKELRLENLSHPDLRFSVVSLDPGPLEVDKQMEGLKRIELRVPAWTVAAGKTKIRIRLSGE